MSIASILSGKGYEVATISSDASLHDAVGELGSRRIGAMPVLDGEAVIGILSERDIIYCLQTHGAKSLERRVGDVMSKPAITVEPSTRILTALAMMTQRRIRHLPVIDSGKLAGIVSIGDLVKYRIEQIEAEAEAMRTYIQQA